MSHIGKLTLILLVLTQGAACSGDADRMVPYDGGPLGDPFNPVKPVFPAIGDFVAGWVGSNECTSDPILTRVAHDATAEPWAFYSEHRLEPR